MNAFGKATLVALVFAMASAASWAMPSSAWGQKASIHAEVNQAWVYLEAGDHNRAEALMKKAYAEEKWGPVNAELYFLLSAIFWERRNAMAAYQWLSDGVKARTERAYAWEPGDGWDARIDKRKRFVERNFGIIKMRSEAGRPVPPLMDPPSRDPVVKAFADGIAEKVSEAAKAGGSTLWLVVPKGTYWVGDELKTVEAGNLELSKAPLFELAGEPHERAAYNRRVAEIKAGRSPAKEILDALAAAESGSETGESSLVVVPPAVEVKAASLGSGMRVALGAGAALGTQRGADGSDAGIGGDLGMDLELGYDLAPPDSPVGLRLAGRFGTASAPACDAAQSRALMGGFLVGPRVSVSVASGAWFTATFGGRVSGGRAPLGSDVRGSCAAGPEGDGAWRLQVGDGTVKGSELGWRGELFGAGPFGEVGLLVAPSVSAPRLGFGVQFAYDRLMPILDEARTVRYRGADGSIRTVDVSASGSEAAFGRVTVSARVVVLVP